MSSHLRRFVHICIPIGLVVVFLVQSAGVAPVNASRSPAACGAWLVEVSAMESRWRATQLPTEAADCKGRIRLENLTSLLGMGGYSLELTPTVQNAAIAWFPPPISGNTNQTHFLIPPLALDLDVTPTDPGQPAEIVLRGSMTGINVAALDVYLFIVRTIVGSIPVSYGCAIPEETIFYLGLRGYGLLTTAASHFIQGEIYLAKNELVRVWDDVVASIRQGAEEAGINCLEEVARKILGVALYKIKLIASAIAYFGTSMFDYWLVYQGEDAVLRLSYSPVAAPTDTPFAASTMEPVDRFDRISVIRWFLKAISEKDVGELETLASPDFIYHDTPDSGMVVPFQDFLNDLSARLETSDPKCEYFSGEPSGYGLQIWMSGWSPPWEMTQSCTTTGCYSLSPPLENSTVGFLFIPYSQSEMPDVGWQLGGIWLSGRESWEQQSGGDFTECDAPL